jgi:hypothetical protein
VEIAGGLERAADTDYFLVELTLPISQFISRFFANEMSL